MTLSVRQIAITASKEDVQDFFARKIPDGDPIVKSLVNDANRVFKSATVTFKGRTKAECKATIERLKDPNCRTLLDGTGISSNLDFDGDFLGLTELANRCAFDEKPHFEYVLRPFTCSSNFEYLQRLFCPWLGWPRIQLLPSQGEVS